jgi:hypothetical protein
MSQEAFDKIDFPWADHSQPKPESWRTSHLRLKREHTVGDWWRVFMAGSPNITVLTGLSHIESNDLMMYWNGALKETIERGHAAQPQRDIHKERCNLEIEPASPPPQPWLNLPCGCTIEQDDRMKSSVFWNEFNRVIQCHKCGQVYEPVSPLSARSDQKKEPYSWITNPPSSPRR